MSKHTPGPWAWFNSCLVTSNEDGSISLNSKIVIYARNEGSLAATAADAQLIAAAPELLKVLKLFVLNYSVLVADQVSKSAVIRDYLQTAFEEASKVIAKAEQE